MEHHMNVVKWCDSFLSADGGIHSAYTCTVSKSYNQNANINKYMWYGPIEATQVSCWYGPVST